jgi:hypothetical protein
MWMQRCGAELLADAGMDSPREEAVIEQLQQLQLERPNL